VLNARALLVGAVIGLVFGGGIASLVWILITDENGAANADVAAVCGVVERTPVPDQDTPIEDLRRWGVGEVLPSIAKANPEFQPLAEAMQKTVRSMQTMDFDEMRSSVDEVKRLCAEV
jgi:hypothetical protein